MVVALQTDFGGPSPLTWSLYAGLYLFSVGVIVSLAFSDILSVLADVIGLQVPYAVVVFACPVLVFGTGTWWVVVERRRAYLYRNGALVGVATAVLTGVVWMTVFVAIWGVEMATVPMVAYLIALVLASTSLVGGLAGLPLLAACRRLHRG